MKQGKNMDKAHPDISVTGSAAAKLSWGQRSGLAFTVLAVVLWVMAGLGLEIGRGGGFWLWFSLLAGLFGVIGYAWATYRDLPLGVKYRAVWFRSLATRGMWAWVLGAGITAFYIILYFYPALLGLGQDGAANSRLIGFFDPLSIMLKQEAASQWFVYGVFYTLAVLAMGVKFILKYRHNRYQVVRTLSVMFFQLGFAFLLPEFFQRFNLPATDLKQMWPLNYYFFQDWNLRLLIGSGNVGLWMLFTGLAMIFVISPVLTYYFGKRWYCSWVCGCGGLAETAGDPFRHLSDKSLGAWRLERWLVHSVLVFVVVMTLAQLYAFFHKNPEGYFVTRGFFLGLVLCMFLGGSVIGMVRPGVFSAISPKVKYAVWGIIGLILLSLIWAYWSGSPRLFFISSYKLSKWYGFYIGAIFSGVVGVGFYPVFGSRVWCRFGCPMAAILGLQQRFFSRFRITVNGGQCISCGNCTVYCEMGIDVRAYAQRGQDVVRAACVGCGICAEVCPRGVLRLENAPDILGRGKEIRALHIRQDGVKLEMD
jgi:polyferredoxin